MSAKIALGVLLGILAGEDARNKSIPLWPVLMGLTAAFLYGVSNVSVRGMTVYEEIMAVSPGLITIVISCLFSKHVGMGDGLILIMTGFILPPFQVLSVLGLTFLIIYIYIFGRFILRKDIKIEIPFVPFLFMGYVICIGKELSKII